MAVPFNISLVRQNNAIGLSVMAITMDLYHPHSLFEESFVEIHELCISIAITIMTILFNLYIVSVAIVEVCI